MKEKTELEKALECYLRRQSRVSHPEGRTDNGGRFYPSESELCECCDSIRSPSRSYPWSYMIHCRTIPHIANLYEVDVKELRKLHREHKKQNSA